MAGGVVGNIIGGILTGGAGSAIGAGIGAALPSLAEIAKTIAERLVPDPVQAAQVQKEIETVLAERESALVTMLQTQNTEQNAINLEYAKAGSFWQSGARPAALWVFVVGFAYNFLFAPILAWAGAIAGNALGISFPAPVTLDNDILWVGLSGLLGLGTLRTYERVQGVSAPSAAAHNPSIPRR